MSENLTPNDLLLRESELTAGLPRRQAEEFVELAKPIPVRSGTKKLVLAQILALAQSMGMRITEPQRKALPGLLDFRKEAIPGSTSENIIRAAEAKRLRKAERNKREADAGKGNHR